MERSVCLKHVPQRRTPLRATPNPYVAARSAKDEPSTRRGCLFVIEATENSLSVLEIIHENEGAGITGIAEETGLAKSTVHDHIETLEELGYVVQSDHGFRLSYRFVQFGFSLRNRVRYSTEVEQKVTQLARRTDERAHYVVEERGKSVFLFTDTGENAIKTNVSPGDFVPLYATASGKAILAHLPEPRIETIITEIDLDPVTERTITDKEELRIELQQIRSGGVAYNDGEYIDNLWSVGAPVFDTEDSLLGSMSVSVPANRLRHDGVTDELTAKLLETVNELELDIAYA